MKFVDSVLMFFSWLGSLISDGFNYLFEFLASLFQGFFAIIDFIFYFLVQALTVIFVTIKIFIALFQYLFVITGMFIKAISSFVIPHFEPYVMPSNSNEGLSAMMEFIEPTGILTIVPFALSCFCWFFFVKKVIGLFGGEK